MSKHHRPLRRGLVALALCGASSAFAGIEVGGGLGGTTGGSSNDSDVLVFDFEAGYRFENNLALHAVMLSDFNGRGLCMLDCEPLYIFKGFYGAKALGYLPVHPRVELLGGVGVGQTTLTNIAVGYADQRRTEALLSAGVQWKVTQSFRMLVEYDVLSSTSLQMLTARMHWEF
jgi:hypothetical protein